MKLTKRWILGLVFTLLLATIILLVAVGWSASTETGSQWLIRQASYFIPGKLEIAEIEGNLLNRLKVTDVKYQQDDLQVEVAEAELKWLASALLGRLVHIEQLTIDNVRVQLPAGSEGETEQPPSASEPFVMPDIVLPFKLQLDDAQITQVSIQPANGQSIEFEEIYLQATVADSAEIQQLKVVSSLPDADIQLQLDSQAALGLQAPHPVNLQLNWQAQLPDQPTFNGELQANGDLTQLDLQHQVKQPFNLELTGTAQNVVSQPSWDMQLVWEQLTYPFTAETPAIADLQQGLLHSSGNLDEYQVQLHTHVQGEQIPAGFWQLQATGDTKKLQIEQLTSLILEGEIDISGDINWQDELIADIELETNDIVLTELWDGWSPELTANSQLKAQWRAQILDIENLNLAIPQTDTQLQVAGTVDLTQPSTPQFANTLQWENLQYPLHDIPIAQATNGQATLQGTLDAYQLELDTQLQGEQIPAGQWQATVNGSLQQAEITQLHGDILAGEVSATGQVAWADKLNGAVEINAEKLVLTELWADWQKNLALNGVVKAEIDDKDVTLSQVKLSIPKTKTQINAKGTAKLLEQPTFNVNADWKNLQYPLLGRNPTVNSQTGQVTVTGQADDYQVKLNTRLSGQDIPAGRWQANGRGNTQQFNLAGLHGDVLAGKLDLSGKVAWQPQVNWQMQLKGKNLNPAKQWQDLPGRLAVDIRSQGRLDAKQRLNADVVVKHIKGKINNYPVQITAQAAAKGDNYELSSLKVRSGKNRFTAKGKLGKQLQADWQLKAPQLGILIPQAKGVLQGQGKLSGTPNAPIIQAKLTGKNVEVADNKLKRLKADIQASLQKNGKIDLDIQANDLQQQGKVVVETISLTGKGQVEKHQLNAAIKTPQDSVNLQLNGLFDTAKTEWRGLLQQLNLDTGVAGRWQLDKPAKLTASPQAVALADSCLTQAKAAICTGLDWNARTGSEIQAEIKRVSLGIVNPLISGDVNGQLDAQLSPKGRLTALGDLSISPGQIKTGEFINADTIAHNGGTLQVTLNQKGLKTDVNLRLLDQSGITGFFAMPQFDGLNLNDNQPIAGEFKVFFPDLSILPSFIPDLANTKGLINSDIQIAGTVGKPQIKGVTEIVNAETEYLQLGLSLKNINVKLIGDGTDQVLLDGRLESGEGHVTLKGKTVFTTLADWQSNLNIVGERLEVMNTPDVWAEASPDLRVTVQPQALDVTGKIVVPAAKITPNLITASGGEASAIPISQDVVIITDEIEDVPTPIATAMQIRTRVQLILGDDIKVDTTGFKSRLGGSLWVETEPPELMPVLNGQIMILDGTYKAYTQDLDIEQGTISYDGGPIDNPTIYIKAVRKIHGDREVKSAGVIVSGAAQALQLNLISEPKVPDGEILSYIITGRNALGQAGEGNRPGINSLRLGTYIQPNLYVAYGISLFDRTSVFTMRYEINETWGIEAEVGQVDKGVGISYTLEY